MSPAIDKQPLPPVTGEAANGLTVVCLACGARTSYGAAVLAGWTFDRLGPPFKAYYCREDS